MKTVAVIVAAGRSERFGGPVPKQFHEIAGRPVLAWTIQRFEAATSIDSILLVVGEDQLLYVGEKVIDPFGYTKVSKIVPGGASRQESVLKGLNRLPISTELVAIHDGARPLIDPADINAVVAIAEQDGAAMLATKMTDTVKRAKDGYVLSTLDRNELFLAQTPQVFGYDLIIEAHKRAAKEGLEVTDDAALIEAAGFKVRLVESQYPNQKVTTREDLMLVSTFFAGEANE
ncbi:MAG: 2-C-methyl-D-erythritol 4-phosphate cytidylyltransferase [candidate division Zixibacteria bacterium]|nr:2-C-methyl-D-erythritol 4-phosphate cytidylyltransferase [candidate division Zixibacteria bacterium]